MGKHIKTVGFEIEGGWDGKPRVPPFEDVDLTYDGSINGQTLDTNIPGTARIDAVHVGEVNSPVFTYAPTNAEEQPKWTAWLLSHWPNAAPPNRTNNTCGFHIHVGMETMLDYSLLTSGEVPFMLKEQFFQLGKAYKLPKKHALWARLAGINHFANYETEPASQMAAKRKGGSNRYGVVNYCFGLHKTIELRVLPTFRDAALGVAFADCFFLWVDKYLDEKVAQPMPFRRSTGLQIEGVGTVMGACGAGVNF